jgi:hypothetical protein
MLRASPREETGEKKRRYRGKTARERALYREEEAEPPHGVAKLARVTPMIALE